MFIGKILQSFSAISQRRIKIMIAKTLEMLGYAIIVVMLMGWTNVFGDHLNWWYLIYILGN